MNPMIAWFTVHCLVPGTAGSFALLLALTSIVVSPTLWPLGLNVISPTRTASYLSIRGRFELGIITGCDGCGILCSLWAADLPPLPYNGLLFWKNSEAGKLSSNILYWNPLTPKSRIHCSPSNRRLLVTLLIEWRPPIAAAEVTNNVNGRSKMAVSTTDPFYFSWDFWSCPISGSESSALDGLDSIRIDSRWCCLALLYSRTPMITNTVPMAERLVILFPKMIILSQIESACFTVLATLNVTGEIFPISA